MNNPVGLLSSMTNLPQAELRQRVQQMADPKTGSIRGLKALDAALASADAGTTAKKADAYTAGGSQSQTAHVMQTPADAFMRPNIPKGYAPGEDMGQVPSVGRYLEKMSEPGKERATTMSAMGFTDDVAAGFSQMMGDVAQKMQDFKKGPKPGEDQTSRQMQFEIIKQQMQKISQISQALTNTLNMMHQAGMAAIRNTRA
jgi:hypothetical protein